MRKLKIVLTVLLFLSVFVGGIYIGMRANDTQLGDIALLDIVAPQPLIIWLMSSFVMGVVLACALGTFIVSRMRLTIFKLRSDIKKQEKELSRMRTMSLSDGA